MQERGAPYGVQVCARGHVPALRTGVQALLGARHGSPSTAALPVDVLDMENAMYVLRRVTFQGTLLYRLDCACNQSSRVNQPFSSPLTGHRRAIHTDMPQAKSIYSPAE